MRWFRCAATAVGIAGSYSLAVLLWFPASSAYSVDLIIGLNSLVLVPIISVFTCRWLALRRSLVDTFHTETRCRKCGYILKGITEPRCPECGTRI